MSYEEDSRFRDHHARQHKPCAKRREVLGVPVRSEATNGLTDLLGAPTLSNNIGNNAVTVPAMIKVKVTAIGNSMGIILPKEALTKLHADKGDVLFLVDTPEGLTLTPYQQDFEAQMDAAEKVMKKYRNALHELAK
jgi:putative addiction module antidote